MQWLRSELTAARAAKQKAVLFGHIPIHPGDTRLFCLRACLKSEHPRELCLLLTCRYLPSCVSLLEL